MTQSKLEAVMIAFAKDVTQKVWMRSANAHPMTPWVEVIGQPTWSSAYEYRLGSNPNHNILHITHKVTQEMLNAIQNPIRSVRHGQDIYIATLTGAKGYVHKSHDSHSSYEVNSIHDGMAFATKEQAITVMGLMRTIYKLIQEHKNDDYDDRMSIRASDSEPAYHKKSDPHLSVLLNVFQMRMTDLENQSRKWQVIWIEDGNEMSCTTSDARHAAILFASNPSASIVEIK